MWQRVSIERAVHRAGRRALNPTVTVRGFIVSVYGNQNSGKTESLRTPAARSGRSVWATSVLGLLDYAVAG
jgi:hypothetical protein